MYFTTIDISSRADCQVCQGLIETTSKTAEQLVWLCGRNTVNVNPPEPVDVELDDAYRTLKRDFKMLARSSLAVVFKHDGDVEVSLFNGGRMLIKNIKSEKDALNVYKEIMEKIRQGAL
jgi:hypothetical protein